MVDKVKTWVMVGMLVSGLAATCFLAVDKYWLKPVSPDSYVITPDAVVNAKAEVIIEGPAEITIGQLARLTVEKSAGKTFKWQVLPAAAAENLQIYDDGRRAVFSSPSTGEVIFIVACSNEGDVDVKTYALKITNGVVVPPNTPDTPVNPATGVVGRVYDWAKSVNAIASQIDSGQLTTADDIAAATKVGNRTALGNSLQAWVPFLEKLQKEMRTQSEAGLLVTPPQHSLLWRQIAEGLMNIAK
jgi:hypothetical protein